MAISVQSITGRQTTAGASEETVSLVLNGAAAATSLSVAPGSTLFISDVIYGGRVASAWRIQQANDGSTFFDIARFSALASDDSATGANSALLKFEAALSVDGDSGSNVVIRVRVTTAGGSGNVSITVRSYVES